MTNFGAKILNNAVGALNAQQAIIANLGNNIANVNTPGYSRREVSLETNFGRGSGTAINVGNGVRIGSLDRVSDDFIERLLRESQGNFGLNRIQSEFLGRIEGLFNLTGDRLTIGSTLSAFFTSLDDLASNPASIELRANVLERAQDLTDTIRNTYNSLARLQTEADQRLVTEMQTVNSILGQIGQLNGRIQVVERNGAGPEASDERDQRDLLLAQLAEKISFNSIELADGTVLISLANGLSLVNGSTVRTLGTTTTPSFAGGALPPSLEGGVLSYIVYDYDTTGNSPAHVDLTRTLKAGTGSVAGLLALRGYNDSSNTTAFEGDGVITEIASRVEALTRSLLTVFNTTYLGPDRDGVTAGHQPSSADLDDNNPAVFGFFDFEFSGVKDRGAIPDGLPTETDLIDITANTTTRNFSSILTLAISNPRQIAAARDASSGPPAIPVYAEGDNRNLLALIDLRSQPQTLTSGSFSLTATWDQAYVETVTFVGNRSASVSVASSVAQSSLATAQARRDSISAVNLDEEFTRLIQAQKSYEASARMIRVADELLQQILQLI
jgi:flagellar hook-associated protein 1 FlgK